MKCLRGECRVICSEPSELESRSDIARKIFRTGVAAFICAAPIPSRIRGPSTSWPRIVLRSCRPLDRAASSRFTSQAMLESCSIVTATLPTETGAFSFSPLRMPAMKLAKCASVMESAPMRSAVDVCLPHLELVRLLALQVVDLVAITVDEHRSRGPHDHRSAVPVVDASCRCSSRSSHEIILSSYSKLVTSVS